MRLCCPKCCEGYDEELNHCPRCGPLSGKCSCAAGPWRYDVENVPKDGSEIWGEFLIGTQVMKMTVNWDTRRMFWGNDCFSLTDNQLRAFAIPNQPETQK